MIKVIVHGCHGTMGKVLIDSAKDFDELEIVAGIDTKASDSSYSFPVFKSIDDYKNDCDVIIDFSLPSSLPSLLKGAKNKKAALILATTGFNEEDEELIKEYSKSIAIFRSANMSLGVNLMYDLLKIAASALKDTYDIEIIEKHHNLKIDSPSGTAYAMADAIDSVLDKPSNRVFGRHSKDDKREAGDIGIHSIRGGTIVGEHSVIFAGKDEILEIKHTAYSKQIFATGALKAALFLAYKSPGLYNMDDLIKSNH